MTILETIKNTLESRKDRSAWNKGVTEYAIDLLENLESLEESDFRSSAMIEKALLNGASSWSQYSWGGCALCYDEDIAKTLCNPSELRKTRNGERRPNSSEEWLDVQARALYQSCNLIKRTVRQILDQQAA